MKMLYDEKGWAAPAPVSGVTQFTYVSGSGADTNAGATPSNPMKTLAAAAKRLRPGKPDWLLLDAATEFREQLMLRGKTGPEGEQSDPMVVTSYGPDKRATIVALPGATPVNAGNKRSNLAILNLHVTGRELPTNLSRDPGILMHWTAGGHLENCLVELMGMGFDLGGSKDTPSSDFRIRRNVSIDNFENIKGFSQGGYCNWTDGLIFEANVFDRNGWQPGVKLSGADSAIKNHCLYLAETNKRVKGWANFFGRACSHGLQNRCGGTFSGNTFWMNPIHALGEGDWTEFVGNYMQNSAPLAFGTGDPLYVHQLRGWGYQLRSRGGHVAANIAVHGGLPGLKGNTWAFNEGEINEERAPDKTKPSKVMWLGNVVHEWAGLPLKIEQARAERIERDNVWDTANYRFEQPTFVVTEAIVDELRLYSKWSNTITPYDVNGHAMSTWAPKLRNSYKLTAQAASLAAVAEELRARGD